MTTPSSTAPALSDLAGSWVLDPARTSIVFHTKAMWVLKVKGEIKATEGSGTVATDGDVAGKLVMDAASVDTGNKKRDTHLRTADFFDVETYPTFDFAVTGTHPVGPGKVEVTGDLTIHGQTKPLTFVADVSHAGGSAAVAAEFDLDRSHWGVTWAKMGAGLGNRVEVKASFTKA